MSVEASAAVAVLHAVLVANDAVNPLFGGNLMRAEHVEQESCNPKHSVTHDIPLAGWSKVLDFIKSDAL
jgi:hypothetical protein